jgi:hypothetical protein
LLYKNALLLLRDKANPAVTQGLKTTTFRITAVYKEKVRGDINKEKVRNEGFYVNFCALCFVMGMA